VILTIVRFIQGMGIGGEWGGATLIAMEWARTNKHRGFITSWPQWGGPAGLFLANLIGALVQLALRQTSSSPGDGACRSGLSIVMVGPRALHPARHPRNADLSAHCRRAAGRAYAGPRSASAAAAIGSR